MEDQILLFDWEFKGIVSLSTKPIGSKIFFSELVGKLNIVFFAH